MPATAALTSRVPPCCCCCPSDTPSPLPGCCSPPSDSSPSPPSHPSEPPPSPPAPSSCSPPTICVSTAFMAASASGCDSTLPWSTPGPSSWMRLLSVNLQERRRQRCAHSQSATLQQPLCNEPVRALCRCAFAAVGAPREQSCTPRPVVLLRSQLQHTCLRCSSTAAVHTTSALPYPPSSLPAWPLRPHTEVAPCCLAAVGCAGRQEVATAEVRLDRLGTSTNCTHYLDMFFECRGAALLLGCCRKTPTGRQGHLPNTRLNRTGRTPRVTDTHLLHRRMDSRFTTPSPRPICAASADPTGAGLPCTIVL